MAPRDKQGELKGAAEAQANPSDRPQQQKFILTRHLSNFFFSSLPAATAPPNRRHSHRTVHFAMLKFRMFVLVTTLLVGGFSRSMLVKERLRWV